MDKLIDITEPQIAPFLNLLLSDKSTKKNIIWATDSFQELGNGFSDTAEMNARLLTENPTCILPRIEKTEETQVNRTRKRAEVFTPAWLCNRMNNYCDEIWFERKNVFNHEDGEHNWSAIEEPITFPKRKSWKHYVDSERLEITCGEAPFLVSRYDSSSGILIANTKDRIGQLDRKLRVINENALDYDEWIKWSIRAYEATYGYEYQGDNLLIGRINLFLSFIEYHKERWERDAEEKLLKVIANRIAWNLWQMDGLKDSVPLGKEKEDFHQINLYEMLSERKVVEEYSSISEEEISEEQEEGTTDNHEENNNPLSDEEIKELGELKEEKEAVPCKIFTWRRDNSTVFKKLKEREMEKKLFDFVIGNPPYQEEQNSDNLEGSKKNYAPPVYNLFMDEANKVAEATELIHPARFLFNAGSTPKAWNEKKLNDIHFKVLSYEPDSNKIFPGLTTPIKGGIAITYHDWKKNFGAIEVFNQYREANSISDKVINYDGFESFMNIVYPRTSYRLAKKMHEDYPNAISKLSNGHAYDMASNIFERLPEIFFDNIPNDNEKYVKILGRLNNKRVEKYIRREYINNVDNLEYWKLFIPQANGNGTFGEAISQPIVDGPGVGHTETFISIGKFANQSIAENALKYIRTKFSRTLLSLLKVTQNGNQPVWKMIPLQDFSSTSDIDWSKSVHEIDLQLYQKYGLSEEEIEFIETHVKEMA